MRAPTPAPTFHRHRHLAVEIFCCLAVALAVLGATKASAATLRTSAAAEAAPAPPEETETAVPMSSSPATRAPELRHRHAVFEPYGVTPVAVAGWPTGRTEPDRSSPSAPSRRPSLRGPPNLV